MDKEMVIGRHFMDRLREFIDDTDEEDLIAAEKYFSYRMKKTNKNFHMWSLFRQIVFECQRIKEVCK
jgi:hypothetical protein